MKTQTETTLTEMTPEKALALLKEGNRRFLDSRQADRNLIEQQTETSQAQYPFAVVLGCIDSRVPPELIFDLGIGDIFGIRIAGNFVNQDILGSMEFACKVVGSKQILVLGHTACGAIQGAYDKVEMGHLTGLIAKLQPAVDAARSGAEQGHADDIDAIAEMNVRLTIEKITQQSPILKEMLDQNLIGISGGMYDVKTGKVTFL
jgi:carbonic anhydrase